MAKSLYQLGEVPPLGEVPEKMSPDSSSRRRYLSDTSYRCRCRSPISFTPYIFTKIVIDSVNVPARALYGRTLINLNCGFRSLAPGTPKF